MVTTCALAQLPDTQIIGDRALVAAGLNQQTAIIISREEIEQRGVSNIVDLLQSVAGIFVDQSNGLNTSGTISIRGADPNFTLVLVDGIRVNNPTDTRGGTFDFSNLNITNIERIEILKGPQSYAYGSSALGGVINIVTTSIRHDSLKHNIELGNRGLLNSATTLNTGTISTHFGITASYLDSGEPRNKSDAIHRNFNADLHHEFNDRSSLKIASRYSKQDKDFFPDDSGGVDQAVFREQQQTTEREWLSSIKFNKILPTSSELNLHISHLQHDTKDASPGVAAGIRNPFGIPSNQGTTRFESTQLLARATIFPNSQATINIGLEGNYEHGKERGIININGSNIANRYRLSRDTFSLFGQIQYSFNDALNIDAGTRIDLPENRSTRFSPQLGFSYFLRPLNTTFRLDAATAFKLPSFFALGNAIVGNPSLKSESSTSLSLSASTDFYDHRLIVESAAFINKFENLIDFTPGPPPQLINRSEVDIIGGELKVLFNLNSRFSITSNFSYNENDIKNSNDELLNRPNWQAFMQTNWQPRDNLAINIQASYIGSVPDSSVPTGERKLDDYVRVDAAAIWAFHAKAELRAAIDNIFDKDYDLAIGVPAKGITPRVNLSFLF